MYHLTPSNAHNCIIHDLCQEYTIISYPPKSKSKRTIGPIVYAHWIGKVSGSIFLESVKKFQREVSVLQGNSRPKTHLN
jgi:hypothetical protein